MSYEVDVPRLLIENYGPIGLAVLALYHKMNRLENRVRKVENSTDKNTASLRKQR